MTKKSRELAEAELLFAALRIGCEANFNVILNSLNGKFYTRFEPQAKLVRLMNTYQERFIALLDKPVILTVDWADDATYATVTVVPADGKESGKHFEHFTLPIPPPYAVML